MKIVFNPRPSFLRIFLCLLIAVALYFPAPAQDLFSFIDNCKDCCKSIKSIKTKHKLDYLDYDSPVLRRTDEYNTDDQLIKTKIEVNRSLSRTIHYKYKDSVLVYEKHIVPGEDIFYLFFQYYKKGLPTKIIKVDDKNQIINISKLEYTKDYVPVFLTSYNLMGELLEKRSVEYYSKNQVVIRSSNMQNNLTYLQKHEMLCKFNKPKKLKKKDFKDLITKPINVEYANNMVRVVKAVQTNESREKVHIDEIQYDEFGNWVNKRTYELKNNKNKRRLLYEIKREIEYY